MRHRLNTIAISLVATCVLSCELVGQAPTLDHLFPPGGQRGQTTTVTAGGKFTGWPPKVWTDSTELTVTPLEEKGQLTVAVSADATPGRHWIRLYDDSGGTRLRPFVVGNVRETNEEDQNDALLIDLANPLTINGRLAANNEVDTYPITLPPGEQLVASLDAHRLVGSPMDTVMQLFDVDNQVVLAQADDTPGRDPRIVWPSPEPHPTEPQPERHPAKHSTNLAIRLFAFPETPNQRIGFTGAKNFVYRLTLSTTGLVDYATPLSISRSQIRDVKPIGWSLIDGDNRFEIRYLDNTTTGTIFRDGVPGFGEVKIHSDSSLSETADCSRDSPLAISIPSTVTGSIEAAGDVDAFAIEAEKDVVLTFTVDARALGFPTDPVLEIYDESGKRLQRTDDSQGRDCTTNFKPPATGTFAVVVRDLYNHGGPRHRYLLTATEQRPSYQLTVDNELFTTKVGEEFKIDVTVKRLNGFDAPIYISTAGLPDNSATHTTSKPDGDSAKKVTIVVKPSAVASGPFQIMGTTPKSERAARAETSAVVPQTRITRLWFTATPAAEPTTAKPPDSEP